MLFKVTTSPVPPAPQVKDTKFKAFAPGVNRSMEWCTLESFVQQAEDKEIIPAIGRQFYDVLHIEYQATGVIADTEKAYVFRLIQTALAHYTMYIAMPQLAIRIGDSGTNETTNTDTNPVREWVFQGSRWELAKTAYAYLDMALAEMEKQVAAGNTDFDTFKNDEAYTISKELLIANAREFQRYYNLKTSRRAYTSLRPYIKKAEELRIKSLLCELYDEIKTEIAANALSANNETLLSYMQPLLAEYTLIFALPEINFVQDGNGWMVSENNYDTKPSMGELSQSIQQLLTRAEMNANNYEIILKNFLYDNLDDYPTFRDGGCNELTEDADGDGIPDIDCDDDYVPPGAVII